MGVEILPKRSTEYNADCNKKIIYIKYCREPIKKKVAHRATFFFIGGAGASCVNVASPSSSYTVP